MADMEWEGAGWMDPVPMPSEPTTETSSKRFRCSNCGGVVDAAEFNRLAAEGTHTDALGREGQPNNGVTFCPVPTCHDFTLVEVVDGALPNGGDD